MIDAEPLWDMDDRLLGHSVRETLTVAEWQHEWPKRLWVTRGLRWMIVFGDNVVVEYFLPVGR